MHRLADGIVQLDTADARVMAWKNGGGTTRELAVFPPDAALTGKPFLWRVSIAEVGRDGPFSPFPGYDRSIMLIEGAGMQLDMQDAVPVRLTERFKPLRFSGDADTQCALLDGPVRDFNVMTARAQLTHHCDIIRGGAMQARWTPASETLFAHCLCDSLIVKLRDMDEIVLHAGQSLVFDSRDSGCDARALLLAPGSPASVAVLVTLREPG
ncbi:MAG TPA: HutD family protein [Gammaproteobacteria bacterium]|nr:HutD family protein [Gammaproteobacteria bacterium]